MNLHGSRIQSVVKLQGMHEQSPVQSMKCCKIRGRLERHTLRADWRVFAAKNHLQVGEELLFTLRAVSSSLGPAARVTGGWGTCTQLRVRYVQQCTPYSARIVPSRGSQSGATTKRWSCGPRRTVMIQIRKQ